MAFARLPEMEAQFFNTKDHTSQGLDTGQRHNTASSTAKCSFSSKWEYDLTNNFEIIASEEY